MQIFLQIFVTGFAILVSAIIVNFVANILGIHTWYSFLELIQKEGITKTLKSEWVHLFFLLFFYPLILGASARIVLFLFNKQ